MAEIGLTDDDYARLADGIDARSVNSGDSNGEISTVRVYPDATSGTA